MKLWMIDVVMFLNVLVASVLEHEDKTLVAVCNTLAPERMINVIY
ncbi:hypothetical protein [Amphibacillus cookii]|nr:hypothetical protein [Amphibacillus cookii]MBM7541238.1 hypothetical protein [Amphibacillus cookii]